MKKLFSLYVYFILAVIVCTFPTLSSAEDKKIPESRAEMQLSFAPLVKKTAPAVVNIYTKKKITIQRISPFMDDPIFQHFFGENFGNSSNTERVENSLGSGVIVRNDGLIITCVHVIKASDSITVVLSDRREFDADIVLSDEKTDLALLKINTKGEKLPYLELMDSDKLEVGDIVLAVGNPFGVGQTVTNGIISAPARTTIGTSNYQFFIQTDAAINPGNSGGALVSIDGKLAGINSAIFSRSGESNGVGFAIPSNMVATVINGLDSGKSNKIIRPWFGVSTQKLTREIATSLGLDRPSGTLIKNVIPESPAAEAGLLSGDVIVKLDNHEIPDEQSLQFRVATYKIGTKVNLSVVRDGKVITLSTILTAPKEFPARDVRILKGNHPFKGMNIANLSPVVADELGFNMNEQGVVIVNPGKSAGLGLEKKDIIRIVNNTQILSTKQLEEFLQNSSNTTSWKLSIQRNNRILNIIWNGNL